MGVWFAGESTRKLHEEFILNTMRADLQRSTSLLSGLLVQSVVTGNVQETEMTIKEYVAGWSEVTYIHVLNDEGFFHTEWKKQPIQFGPDIRKFEEKIEYGGQDFGVLSVYVDTGPFQSAMRKHVSATRRLAAGILLSISMFVIFFVNYFGIKELELRIKEK